MLGRKHLVRGRWWQQMTFFYLLSHQVLVLCDFFFFEGYKSTRVCVRTNECLTPPSLQSTLLCDVNCCWSFVFFSLAISSSLKYLTVFQEQYTVTEGSCFWELQLVYWLKKSDNFKWEFQLRTTFYLHSLQLTPFTVWPFNVRMPSVSSAVKTIQLIVYVQSDDCVCVAEIPLIMACNLRPPPPNLCTQ